MWGFLAITFIFLYIAVNILKRWYRRKVMPQIIPHSTKEGKTTLICAIKFDKPVKDFKPESIVVNNKNVEIVCISTQQQKREDYGTD